MKIYSYVTMINETGNPYIEKHMPYIIDGRVCYRTSGEICDFIYNGLHLQNFAEEYLYILCFDSRMHLIGCFEASHGTVNAAFTSPREVFQKALMIGAVSIVLTHNHPGNDPTPSEADLEITRRIKNGGNLIGINVVDHIIVSKTDHFSMVGQDLFNDL